MGDKPELNWNQLDVLTEEVRSGSGPGTPAWDAAKSHTRRFNAAFIEEFRRTGGQVPGELGEVDILLLTARGAKSGEYRTVPVGYHEIDGRLCILASMGGADNNPPWYHNVVANPEVTVELGPETFHARATVTVGADRDHLFSVVCDRMAVFADYQERTDRLIPVIELQRVEAASTGVALPRSPEEPITSSQVRRVVERPQCPSAARVAYDPRDRGVLRREEGKRPAGSDLMARLGDHPAVGDRDSERVGTDAAGHDLEPVTNAPPEALHILGSRYEAPLLFLQHALAQGVTVRSSGRGEAAV